MTPKSILSRPLDLTYFSFFAFHLFCSVAIDLLVLWPEKAQKLPVLNLVYGVLKGIVDDYRAKTNDPFMLANWGDVERPWEFAHLKVFLWIEALFQVPSFILGMIGLKKNSAAIYPLLLAYSSTAIVTAAAYMYGTIIAPSANDTTLDPHSKFYAMSDEGRWTILAPTIPFLVIPIIMWVDMMVRTGSLVMKGVQAEAQEQVTRGRKTKKEL